jgi:hypothetical protein
VRLSLFKSGLMDAPTVRPLLYHYTTQEAFLSIVTTRKLWASSIYHLNDSTEISYAMSLATNVLNTRTESRVSLQRVREMMSLTREIYLAKLRSGRTE